MTRTLLLFSALLPLTGCAELSAFLPTVDFDRLDVNAVDFDGIDSDFVFKVNNPNPIDVKLARFNYALDFGGVEWATGDDPDGLVLEAAGSSDLALPVSFSFDNLYEKVQAVRGEDNVDFGLNGSFGFNTNTQAGIIDLPYDAVGDFPALRTPKFSFSDIEVTDLSFSEATIAVNLDVDNDHASNLWFTNFAYKLKLAGTKVGAGTIADLGEVDGATTGSLSIPLTIDFLDAGYAVYEAISSGSIDIGLDATTDVETPFGLVPLTLDETGNVQVVY